MLVNNVEQAEASLWKVLQFIVNNTMTPQIQGKVLVGTFLAVAHNTHPQSKSHIIRIMNGDTQR